jgi:hypothetical protein
MTHYKERLIIGEDSRPKDIKAPLVFDDLTQLIEYEGEGQHNVHLGQLKLFEMLLRSFIELAMHRVMPRSRRVIRIIYVGAAPGNSIAAFMDLILNHYNVIMTCYDLVDHCPSLTRYIESGHVVFKRQLFSIINAFTHKGETDIFISDIRNTDASEADEFTRESYVRQDHTSQQDWVRIIQPSFGYSLKFRLPFDMDHAVSFNYLKGKLYIQAFPPPSSTETRLIGSELETASYQPREYEQKFAYYNSFMRGYRTVYAPIFSTCTCVDCHILSRTIHHYRVLTLSTRSIKQILSFHNIRTPLSLNA